MCELPAFIHRLINYFAFNELARKAHDLHLDRTSISTGQHGLLPEAFRSAAFSQPASMTKQAVGARDVNIGLSRFQLTLSPIHAQFQPDSLSGPIVWVLNQATVHSMIADVKLLS